MKNIKILMSCKLCNPTYTLIISQSKHFLLDYKICFVDLLQYCLSPLIHTMFTFYKMHESRVLITNNQPHALMTLEWNVRYIFEIFAYFKIQGTYWGREYITYNILIHLIP